MHRPIAEIGAFSDVVGTIYDCALDPHRWPTAIERVGQLIEAVSGAIMAVDTVENKSRFYADWNVDPAVMQTFGEKYLADNPLTAGFAKFDIDEPFNVTMVMPAEEWRQSRVYRELGRPNGWLDNVLVTLLRTPSRLATLSIVRPEQVGFAGPREIEIARLLSPHLRRAVSIADLMEMRELTAGTFEQALEVLAAPVIFVDRTGAIIHANRAARSLLAGRDPIRSEHGILSAATADANRRLTAAIGQASRSGGGIAEAAAGVFIPFADGRPAFAHVLPMGSGPVRGRIEPRAAAAVFITPASEAPALPLQPWAAAFGLTAAELRLLEKLVEGKSIAAAAAELGVAAATARTHLARVKQKTGTSRQAELVRLAMQLTAPLRKPERQ